MVVTAQLSQALPKLLEQWTPINPEVLSKIKSYSVNNQPSPDIDSMMSDLRSDPFLFCWLLTKEVPIDYLPKSSSSDTSLQARIIKTLSWIAEEGNALRPFHRLSLASPRQQRASRKAITRTTACGVLAPYFNAPTESAFAVAALRELGTSLIIWNYPRIYAQAVEQAEQDTSSEEEQNRLIDQKLMKLLGFGPLTLSIAIARQCDLPEEVQAALSQTTSTASAESNVTRMGSTLAKIAEIGDVFARATLPNASESTLSKWRGIRQELIPTMGASGLTILKDACSQVLQRYVESIPELVAHPIPHGVCTPTPRNHRQLFLQNLHIPHCVKELQDLLYQLYSRIDPFSISFDNVTRLITEITPTAGFSRGSLYLLNPELLLLEPRLSIGVDGESQPAIAYRELANRDNPVVRSFMGKSPVIETQVENRTASFAGILGNTQRVGVLYLEPARDVDKNQLIRPRMHFKALQQALNDCLNLY